MSVLTATGLLEAEIGFLDATARDARHEQPPRLQTVLIEDCNTIREALVPALADLAGAEVLAVADTASEAVALLEKLGHTWDLAVVDLFLREGSGLTVLRTCKQRESHQRMVVLTNYPTDEMRRRSLELGADALFDKSDELEQFFKWCLSRRLDDARQQGRAFIRAHRQDSGELHAPSK